MPSYEESLTEGLALAQWVDNSPKSKNAPPSQHMSYEEKEHASDGPRAPAVFALVTNSGIVGNCDVQDYQPEMYGGNILTALIPLKMRGIDLDVQCYFNSALVTVKGSWRLHCIKFGKACDCLLTVPTHEQATLSSVEIEINGLLYVTQPVPTKDSSQYAVKARNKAQVSFTDHLISLKIPKVNAGAVLSVKVTWSQNIPFYDDHNILSVPFEFPKYVLSSSKSLSEISTISFSVDIGIEKEISISSFSHPLKEYLHQPGIKKFKAQEGTWTNSHFIIRYKVLSNTIWASFLIQEEKAYGDDQHGKFCFFLSPPERQLVQGNSRIAVFIIDRSASMNGQPMDDAIQAVLYSLSKLNTMDCFNIILYNHECLSFSAHLQFATSDVIDDAKTWILKNCQSRGGTNILQALNLAFDMLRKTEVATPHIFLITDGTVEDERQICQMVDAMISNAGLRHPRISTFGIGTYCNHYFLRMLALIGRGLYDAAFSKGFIKARIERLVSATSVSVLTNLAIDIAEETDKYEVYPYQLPDLFVGNPVLVSGNFNGKPPDVVKVCGTLPDMTTLQLNVKVGKSNQIPLDKIVAKQQLDILTSHAWFTGNKRFEDQAIRISLSTGIPCEYTQVVSLETSKENYASLLEDRKKEDNIDVRKYLSTKKAKVATIAGLVLGFGNLSATVSNLTIANENDPLCQYIGDSNATGCAQVSCSGCCQCCDIAPLGDCCCCRCCYSDSTGTCNRMWNNCATTAVQVCLSSICLGCFECSACCR